MHPRFVQIAAHQILLGAVDDHRIAIRTQADRGIMYQGVQRRTLAYGIGPDIVDPLRSVYILEPLAHGVSQVSCGPLAARGEVHGIAIAGHQRTVVVRGRVDHRPHIADPQFNRSLRQDLRRVRHGSVPFHLDIFHCTTILRLVLRKEGQCIIETLLAVTRKGQLIVGFDIPFLYPAFEILRRLFLLPRGIHQANAHVMLDLREERIHRQQPLVDLGSLNVFLIRQEGLRLIEHLEVQLLVSVLRHDRRAE